MNFQASIIAEAGYTSLVSNELKTLSASTDELYGLLETKLTMGDIVKMKPPRATVREAFEKAAAVFVEIPVVAPRRPVYSHVGIRFG